MFPVRYLLLPPLVLGFLKVAVGLYDAHQDVLNEQRRQAVRNDFCGNDHDLYDHFAEECDHATRVVEESAVMRTLGLFAERSKSCVFFECGEGADAFFNSWFFISASAVFFTFLIYGGASNLTELFFAARRHRHSNGAQKCRPFSLMDDEGFPASRPLRISSRTVEADKPTDHLLHNTDRLLRTMRWGDVEPLNFADG